MLKVMLDSKMKLNTVAYDVIVASYLVFAETLFALVVYTCEKC